MVQSPVPVVVMTSPVSDWALGGLFWSLKKYAPEFTDIVVCGFPDPVTKRVPKIPYGTFHSIGDFRAYPKHKWSDSFMKVCQLMLDTGRTHFLFLMDDFWLIRQANVDGVNRLWEGMRRNPDVLKIDLATDRLYVEAGSPYLFGVNTVAYEGYLDIIQSNPEYAYHMSLWVGLFSAKLLLDHVLIPGESAQEIELIGSGRIRNKPEIRVLGTRQAPMLVTNLMRSGHPGAEYRGYKLGEHWVNGIQKHDLDQMRTEGVMLR